MTAHNEVTVRRTLAIDEDMLAAMCAVWDAATAGDDLRGYVDDDLAGLLAACAKLTKLAKLVDTEAKAAVAAHHAAAVTAANDTWRHKTPGAGTVAVRPQYGTRHDIGHAFTLVACQVYGDPDSPAAVDELPSQIKALVDRCARLFTPTAELSLPACDEQGIPRDEVVRRYDKDPKVDFTPAKEQ